MTVLEACRVGIRMLANRNDLQPDERRALLEMIIASSDREADKMAEKLQELEEGSK